MTKNTTTTANILRRSGTTVTNVRTDQLSLGDTVLVAKWDGTVTVRSVLSLRLLNDSVEVEFSGQSGETLCKVGTVWQLVAAL